MTRSIMTTALIGILLAIVACSGSSGPEEGESMVYKVVPGQGLEAAEGSIRLGDTAASLRAAAGTPTVTRDLGDGRVHFTYQGIHVTGILTGGGDGDLVTALYTGEGFEGQTESGLGRGASREDVKAALGEPEVEPFEGTWVFPAEGIGFQWDGEDKVSRIVLF